MSTYADPPALDYLDQIAAACARSPSFAARLLALGLIANLTPTPTTGLTLALQPGWYTLTYPDGASFTVALANGDTFATPGAIYLEAEANGETTDTLTLTALGETPAAIAFVLTAASAVAARLVLMEGETLATSAPRLILGPPNLTSSLEAVAEWGHTATLPLYLLGDGDPTATAAAQHRRYEIGALGQLGTDLMAQSHLGLLRWQIVGLDQAETVGLDPTGALRGHFLGQLSVTAEGQT
jgi:hypothetical protein